MLETLLSLAVATVASAASPAANAAIPGGKVPEFQALKWYNSPPLTLEDLKGKAVLLQVFRTW